jgi:glycosyltransferase involved in cell wall biosynthesis
VTIPDVLPLRWAQYRGSPTAHAYSLLTGRAARHAEAIIAYSEHARGEISALLDIPNERVYVIPPAADPRFRPADAEAQAAARTKYGLGERFILHVGGLDARQNLELLIGAFAAVYNEIGDPELSLFIAGDPQRLGSSALYPDWRPLAATFGVGECIQCAWIAEEDMPAIYSACSCFVFPSLYEGFGLTPLEAMSCGAPVVCSNAGAIAEAVGIAGLQVDPADMDRVSAAITRVLTSRELASDLRQRGLAHVRRFAWDRVAAETSALYAEVSGTKRDY